MGRWGVICHSPIYTHVRCPSKNTVVLETTSMHCDECGVEHSWVVKMNKRELHVMTQTHHINIWEREVPPPISRSQSGAFGRSQVGLGVLWNVDNFAQYNIRQSPSVTMTDQDKTKTTLFSRLTSNKTQILPKPQQWPNILSQNGYEWLWLLFQLELYPQSCLPFLEVRFGVIPNS